MSPIFFPILEDYNKVSHKTCFPFSDSRITRIIRNSVKKHVWDKCGANKSQCVRTMAQSNKHHLLVSVWFVNSYNLPEFSSWGQQNLLGPTGWIVFVCLISNTEYPRDPKNTICSLLVFKEISIFKGSEFHKLLIMLTEKSSKLLLWLKNQY